MNGFRKKAMFKIGKKAPDFKLLDQDGLQHTLKQYLGQYVLLYFYPKDDTPGCTKEACAITDVYKDFKKLGIVVLGVSRDSTKSHKNFAEKYHLPFTLLSDKDLTVAETYGAWQEKTMFGKTALGILRISYLIDGDGKIVKVYPDVDPPNHALQILMDVKELKK
jgi:peroxiredoxin Q/BCP